MYIYRVKAHKGKGLWHFIGKSTETILKSLALVILAMIPAAAATFLWHEVLYKNGIHVPEEDREIIVAAWIPVFGIFYCLLTNFVVSDVMTDYKNIRLAIKNEDFSKFADLRDEDVSPIMHFFVSVLALTVLGGFMAISYASALEGALIVGSATFIFALLCLIVIQIDDPCHGIWFIKNIREDWLTADVKAWRRANRPRFTITIEAGGAAPDSVIETV